LFYLLSHHRVVPRSFAALAFVGYSDVCSLFAWTIEL